MRRAIVLLLLALAGLAAPASAHEMRPGYLQVKQTGEDTYEVLWKVPAAGNNLRLGIYVRFPDGTVETTPHRGRFVGGAFLDRWSVRCPGGLIGKRIHIDGLRRTMTDVLVRVMRLDGSTQTSRIDPSRPSVEIAAAPTFLEVAATYAVLGVEHILLGIDHLLFVLGLLLIVRGKRLVATITAFTVAHSLTLAAATLGVATVPMAPLNAVIALSILFLGPEIVRSWRGGTSLTLRQPWLVAFGFGLLHGFGFATGLETIGLPRSEVVVGLLWFNVGVELGQLGFVFLALVLVRSFRTLEMRWPLAMRRLPGFTVGMCGSWWTFDTIAALVTAT